MPRLTMPCLLALALLCSPARADDKAAVCSASAYNFDMALGMKAQGFAEAEALETMLAMFEGAQNAASRALPGVVRAAWRYSGSAGPQAEAAYLKACLAAN